MIDITPIVEEYLSLAPDGEYRTGEQMSEHTSFRIGGIAALMLLPKNREELCTAVAACRKCGVKPLVIGNGTNLLVNDGELDIAVIKTRGLDEISLSGDCEITVDSGELLSKIAVFACENGLTGFEFAHGIPGTIGGAVSMNAGAYGGEMKDVVIRTEVLSSDGKIYILTGDEHDFSYRHSALSDTDDVVLSVTLKLEKGDRDAIKARMNELMAKRSSSQPLNMPSAGSTFKRPVGGYAAALIDSAGLKGYTVGGAQVSEKHAGFVINRGGASFDDVITVMEHIKKTVYETSGIELEPEVKIIRG